MRIRVLILGLLLAAIPATGCGWRARNAYRPPPPCCPTATLLPATSVPVVAGSPCCPSACP